MQLAENRLCPRCRIPLHEGALQAATGLGCAKCGGVWLDDAACRLLMQGSSAALVALSDRAARIASVSVAPEQASVPCPLCTLPLAQMPAPETNVLIDMCLAHGAWFDANELRDVARAYSTRDAPQPAVTVVEGWVTTEGNRLPPPARATDEGEGADWWDALETVGNIFGVVFALLDLFGSDKDG